MTMVNRTMIFFFGCVFSYVSAIDLAGFIGVAGFFILHVISERDLNRYFRDVNEIASGWRELEKKRGVFSNRLLRTIERLSPHNETREN